MKVNNKLPPFLQFPLLFVGASQGDDNTDDKKKIDTTTIVILVIWQLLLTAGLITVCACYLSRRFKSKNTVTDEDLNFTDLEKINTSRSTPNALAETVTTKTGKLETKINWVTSTTTTRADKDIEEPTEVRKSVQFLPLPQESNGPVPSKRNNRKGPYSVSEDVSASQPALIRAKQSVISMVLESVDDIEV